MVFSMSVGYYVCVFGIFVLKGKERPVKKLCAYTHVVSESPTILRTHRHATKCNYVKFGLFSCMFAECAEQVYNRRDVSAVNAELTQFKIFKPL